MRTWPVMNTTGTESIIASQIGVTTFVAPGPLVASATPTLPGGLGVALGGVAAAGLVADEDVADAGVVEGVVGREVGAAGQPEYDVDTFGLQAFHQGVDCTHGARLLSGFRTRARSRPRAQGDPSVPSRFRALDADRHGPVSG